MEAWGLQPKHLHLHLKWFYALVSVSLRERVPRIEDGRKIIDFMIHTSLFIYHLKLISSQGTYI